MGRHNASHRVDGPHPEIMTGLRAAGRLAISIAQRGGLPGDILVADERNTVLEVKPEGWTGPRNERERRQQELRREWRAAGGTVYVVRSLLEAQRALSGNAKDLEI